MRILTTIIAFLIPLFLVWAGGWDVFSRGQPLFNSLIFSLWLSAAVWFVPTWPKK